MKIIAAILITFLLALATSYLYEFNFISKNPIRYILVLALIIIELVTGFFYIKSEVKNNKKIE
ncbi:hypothetical protein [Flavobacterium aquiphilum]|uniref:hypothetical protein n=1 Tax=Flavobacterium aquiphilum TaxID=3003261 RepID=UPI00248008DA|nr:hypothetical protein [Flavobacterium aquiphilum]